MDCSTLGFPVLYYLPEFEQTHVHWVSMPSNHLILCCPLLLLPSIFPIICVFSNELALRIRWPKYWSFSFSPSSKYSGLISFGTDCLDLPAIQGILKSHLQHHSLKPSIIWCSPFFMVQLHIHTRSLEKPQPWLYRPLSAKWRFYFLICCLAFLPRSKRLLISWLQSSSAVFLEPKKIQSITVSIVSPSISHEVMGPWSSFFEWWVFSQLFHSPLSLSSRGSLVSLCFLPLGWYHLHIWGCWYFSQLSWFQLVIHPGKHLWCILHIN